MGNPFKRVIDIQEDEFEASLMRDIIERSNPQRIVAAARKEEGSGLSLTSPPGPLSNTWRGGEKRILKSPLHAMGRGFRGGVNA